MLLTYFLSAQALTIAHQYVTKKFVLTVLADGSLFPPRSSFKPESII